MKATASGELRPQPCCICHHAALIVPACALFAQSGHALFYEIGANKPPGAVPAVSTVQAGRRLRYLKQYLMFYIIGAPWIICWSFSKSGEQEESSMWFFNTEPVRAKRGDYIP